ncbi:MAG: ribonuclease HII [Lachnospiraceae bacterium]|nr:ribonuclease HII [Lachnospiraceae bacterium]
MQQKIGEIRDIYQAADEIMLPAFIREYAQDGRSGVQALVKKAQKRLSDLEKERARMHVMSEFEDKYCEFSCICGIDEAGRGPLAGPVVAGAVVLDPTVEILYLNDSKKLTAAKREQLYDEIREKALASAVGIVGPDVIDEINILQATYEAMRIAVHNLGVVPDILLNDAVHIPDLPMKQVAIVKGDARSKSIAAASILAKVTRDRIMVEYDAKYPEYGFAGHKGYGSAAHIKALEEFGATPIHRMSFLTHFRLGEAKYGAEHR